MDIASDLIRLVAEWTPRSERDRGTLASFREHVTGSRAPIDRGSGPRHATASALAFSPDLAQTLLVFHRKGRFWVQPGGHIEPGDATVRDAALRELSEESGVSRADVEVTAAHDLDHHALSSRFGRCASHLDVGIGMTVPPHVAVAASDESDAIAWWPLDALPDDLAHGAERRLLEMRDRIRAA